MTTERINDDQFREETRLFAQFLAENPDAVNLPEVEQDILFLQKSIRDLGANPTRITGTGVGKQALESKRQALRNRYNTLRQPRRRGSDETVAEAKRTEAPGIGRTATGDRAFTLFPDAGTAAAQGINPHVPIAGFTGQAMAEASPFAQFAMGLFNDLTAPLSLLSAGLGPAVAASPAIGGAANAGSRPARAALKVLGETPRTAALGEIGASVGSNAAAAAGLSTPLQIAAGFAGGAGAVAAPSLATNAIQQGQRAATNVAQAIPDGQQVRRAFDTVSPIGTAQALDEPPSVATGATTAAVVEGDIDIPVAARFDAEFKRAREGKFAPPKPKPAPTIQQTGAFVEDGSQYIPVNPRTGIAVGGVRAVDRSITKVDKAIATIRSAMPDSVSTKAGIRRVLRTYADETVDPVFPVREDILQNGVSRGVVLGDTFSDGYRTLFQPENNRIRSLEGIHPDVPGAPTIQDVAARLPVYARALNGDQRKFMEELREVVEPMGKALREAGADLGERTDVMEGGFYLPRGTAETVDGPTAQRIGQRSVRAGRPGFTRPAAFDSMAAGIENGFEYPELEAVLSGFGQRYGTVLSDLYTTNYLRTARDADGLKFGLTAKEVAIQRNPKLVQQMESLRALRTRIGALAGTRVKNVRRVMDRFLDDPHYASDLNTEQFDTFVKEINRASTVRRGRLKGANVTQLEEALGQLRNEIRDLKPRYEQALRSATRGRRGVTSFPQLNGVTFPEQMAARAEELLERERGRLPGLLDEVNAIQGAWKAMRATADNSAVGIQALIAGYDDFRAFQRAARVNVRAWAGGRSMAQWRREFDKSATNRELLTLSDWVDSGLVQIQGLGSEFGRDVSVLESLPVFGRVFRGSSRAFAAMSNVTRAEWAQDLLQDELARGRSLREIADSGTLREITSMVNAATGWRNGRFSLANLIVFSWRFLTARFVTMGRAMRGLDLDVVDAVPVLGKPVARRLPRINPMARARDRYARRALLRMIGFATLITWGINEAQGRDTDMRPLVDGKPNPNFLRFRAMNRDWSMMGPWDSSARLLATVGTGDIQRAVRTTANAPLAALGLDLQAGRDFLGRPIYRPDASGAEKATDLMVHIAEDLIPFAADESKDIVPQMYHAMTEGDIGKFGTRAMLGVSEGLGLKSSPLSRAEILELLEQRDLDDDLRTELVAELQRRKGSYQTGAFGRFFDKNAGAPPATREEAFQRGLLR